MNQEILENMDHEDIVRVIKAQKIRWYGNIKTREIEKRINKQDEGLN